MARAQTGRPRGRNGCRKNDPKRGKDGHLRPEYRRLGKRQCVRCDGRRDGTASSYLCLSCEFESDTRKRNDPQADPRWVDLPVPPGFRAEEISLADLLDMVLEQINPGYNRGKPFRKRGAA